MKAMGMPDPNSEKLIPIAIDQRLLTRNVAFWNSALSIPIHKGEVATAGLSWPSMQSLLPVSPCQ